VEEKIIDGNEAFNQALILEPPRTFSFVSVVLYTACLIGFLCSTMNGYDGSLFNAITINKQFLDFFHGSNKGTWQAIVSAMYQIGGVVALPFVGPAIDTYGRRFGMFIGAFAVVLGSCIQGTTTLTGSIAQFMGGRFLLGFGVTIAASAGPMYVVEVSHPAHRGVVTALYNTFWFTGAIVASGAARGSEELNGTLSWSIPVWLQLLFSAVIVTMAFFLPESPRWLYVNNRFDKAKAMLTKFHGEGNPDSIWVTLQLREYEEFLEMDGADKRWWDYRALFRDRASRYRVFCNVMVSIFGQWAGNGRFLHCIANDILESYADLII
jgi:MFS family permease